MRCLRLLLLHWWGAFCEVRVISFGFGKQIQNVVREVVLMRVKFVMQSLLKRLLEKANDVCSVRCGHELKWASNFVDKYILSFDRIFIKVYLVRYAEHRDVRAVDPKLFIPILEILIGDLAVHIKDHHTYMRSKVVRAVQFIKRFLPRGVPDVCSKSRIVGNLPTL